MKVAISSSQIHKASSERCAGKAALLGTCQEPAGGTVTVTGACPTLSCWFSEGKGGHLLVPSGHSPSITSRVRAGGLGKQGDLTLITSDGWTDGQTDR